MPARDVSSRQGRSWLVDDAILWVLNSHGPLTIPDLHERLRDKQFTIRTDAVQKVLDHGVARQIVSGPNGNSAIAAHYRTIPTLPPTWLKESLFIFRTVATALGWWGTPHTCLEGQTPFDKAQRGNGFEEVRQLLSSSGRHDND